MAKKIRSARGEMVDFDLLKIKEQIANAPPSQDVRARQDFIEKRLRRRLKKTSPPAPPVQKTNDAAVETDPKMPATEELTEDPKLIDEVKEPTTPARSRQRARPPAKTDNE